MMRIGIVQTQKDGIKKDSVPVNCKVERSIVESLESFCKKTGMSKTATVEHALREYIDRYNQTGKI